MTRHRPPTYPEKLASVLLMLKVGDEWLIPEPFDTIFGLVQLLAPRPNQGYAPDAAWIMRKLLTEIEKQENAAKSPMTETAG